MAGRKIEPVAGTGLRYDWGKAGGCRGLLGVAGCFLGLLGSAGDIWGAERGRCKRYSFAGQKNVSYQEKITIRHLRINFVS